MGRGAGPMMMTGRGGGPPGGRGGAGPLAGGPLGRGMGMGRPGGIRVEEPPFPVPLPHKQGNITVKQGGKQKEKQKQQPQQPASMNKETFVKEVTALLKGYTDKEKEAEEVVKAIRDLKAPAKLYYLAAQHSMVAALETEGEEGRERAVQLMCEMKEKSIIDSDALMQAVSGTLSQLSELEPHVPLVMSHAGRLLAQTVASSLVTLADIAEPLRGGAHYPLWLLLLQGLTKSQGQDWLAGAFADSKLDMAPMLPEPDQSQPRMMSVLTERGLGFLFPELQLSQSLHKQLAEGMSAPALYRWLKDSVNASRLNNPDFLAALVTSVVQFACEQTTLAEGVDPQVQPDKALAAEESELLGRYKVVFQKLLSEKASLQLRSLYAVQVFCHDKKFPKGMMLRLFMTLYDGEMIDEETFLVWKEDINDTFPGKGKALIQVNTWLTWLEHAEEESEEDEE